ncbi:uncharacterized protein EMH_0017250 [Eimeria mitis]|uniref:Uncharacterized protein n=1 Tax=Eimeria mitis TaxID=44415 RepID=U6KA97_9EIME|nr:uncharacterized protein EMH_0017250 [Eimeria mitis]CDJ33741.1 hypothetical protein EMH_0017250 [Eimeria mitis]
MNGNKERPESLVLTGDPSRVVQSPGSFQKEPVVKEDPTAPTAEAQSDEEEGGIVGCLLTTEGAKKNVQTEADLLATLVQRIDFATAAVPRGAHRLHGTKIIPATEFQVEALRAQTSKDYQFNVDFLEPLNYDVPRGQEHCN